MDVPINEILVGDVLDRLAELPDGCVHCVVTSPPYWGLRDYGIEPSVWGGEAACEHAWGQVVQPAANGIVHEGGMSGETLSGRSATRQPKRSAFCSKCGAWRGCYGLEPTPDLYVQHTVEIFRQVRRVMRDDAVLFLNLGDSYASGKGTCFNPGGGQKSYIQEKERYPLDRGNASTLRESGLKPKDLVGIPWRVAFALQADGWWLRQDIIWSKPNPMPESVTDRCTKAHEYVFLLTKRPRYWYDAEAVKEKCDSGPSDMRKMLEGKERIGGKHKVLDDRLSKASMYTNIGQKRSVGDPSGRNRRSVWTVPTAPFKEAHFATFPPELIRPCIRAGTSAKGCCPQCGAPWRRVVEKAGGTTGKSWHSHTRDAIAGMSQYDPKCQKGGVGKAKDDNGNTYTVETIGWRPTCTCDAGDPVPCIVLDPFGGSGTTGYVAAQEGRNYILIELNPEYAEMARHHRLAEVETAVPVREARNGQMALFEQAGARATGDGPRTKKPGPSAVEGSECRSAS